VPCPRPRAEAFELIQGIIRGIKIFKNKNKERLWFKQPLSYNTVSVNEISIQRNIRGKMELKEVLVTVNSYAITANL
jgi:hypothetical protein